MLKVFFLLLLAPGIQAEGTVAALLAGWGVSLKGLGEFKLRPPPKSLAGTITEIEGENGKRLIRITRIEALDDARATRYSDGKRAEILSMYTRQFDGYFPPQAKGKACAKKMKPVLRERRSEGTFIKSLSAMANERFVTGICDEGQAFYRLVVALVYCEKKKEMYDVRYFSPRKGFSEKEETAILSMTCAS